jgi:cobalt/nickel transport system permease protein
MPTSFLERYVRVESPVHRADGRVKLPLTLGFIAATTATPPAAWPVFLVLGAAVWAGILLARLPPLLALGRSMLAIPFVLIAFPTIFTRPGEPILTLPILSWQVSASWEGLAFFLSVLVKAWICVLAAVLLTATTPFEEIALGMRFLRLPRVVVAIFSFLYRYIFVLVDEALRLVRAREARSARLGRGSGGSLLWRARVTGGMAGSLFLRTYERSERIYQAMQARGYDGEVRTGQGRPLSLSSLAFLRGILVFLASLEAVALILW